MKNKIVFFLTILLLPLVTNAQVPGAINWQFLLRDISASPLIDKQVVVKTSFHEGSSVGTVVFSETFDVNTGPLGLVRVILGKGVPESGNINNIMWGTNTYYIETAVEFEAGQGFVSLGITEFASVPYAFLAETTDQATIPLHSGGGIMLPKDIVTCDISNKGALHYNTTTKKVEYCNGTDWIEAGIPPVIPQ